MINNFQWNYKISATREGNFDNVFVPSDSQNLKCGVDSQVKDKPYLFFFDITKCVSPTVVFTGCRSPQVLHAMTNEWMFYPIIFIIHFQICVEKCPTEIFYYVNKLNCTNSNIKYYQDHLICKPDYNKNLIRTCDNVEKAINDNDCAQWYLPSQPSNLSIFFTHKQNFEKCKA
jgi:choline transporter-like protein 2/4/5